MKPLAAIAVLVAAGLAALWVWSLQRKDDLRPAHRRALDEAYAL